MSVYLRRLRGVAGIGPLWAAVWVVMLTALTYRFLPFDGDVGSASLTSTIGWVGLVSGGVFDR